MSKLYYKSVITSIFVFSTISFLYNQIPTKPIIQSNGNINIFDSVNDSLSSKDYYYAVMTFNSKNSMQLKAPKTFKLDSSISNNFQKSEFLLTDTLDVAFIYEKDNDDLWVPRNFSARHYNKKGLLTKQTWNPWNGENYDVDERFATVIRKYSYTTEGLLDVYQDFNSGDIANNMFSNLHYHFYDTLGRLDSIVEYFWFDNEDTTRVTDRIFYSYNDQNQLIESVKFEYDINNEIDGGDSIRYYYNEFGKIDFQDSYLGRDEEGFRYIYKTVFTYNENESLNQILYKEEINENEFLDVGYVNYFYYQYGSLWKYEQYNLNSSGQYKPWEKEEYYHNENVDKSKIILYRDFESRIPDNQIQDHMLNKKLEYFYSSFNDDWVIDEQLDFYYSDISTSTEDIVTHLNTLTLYPNPAFDQLSIDLQASKEDMVIRLWDASGSLILQDSFSPNVNIDISHLPSGLYFCNVYSGKNMWQGRFVKQ